MSLWKVIVDVDESSKGRARKYIYVTKTNNSTNPPTRKIGVSGINGGEDVKTKLQRYSTCLPQDWQLGYLISVEDVDADLRELESKFFAIAVEHGATQYLLKGKKSAKELFSLKDDNKLIDAIADFTGKYGGKLVVWPKEHEKKLAEKRLLEEKNIKEKTMKESGAAEKYTKKQITEAIAYWEKQLKSLNEGWGPRPLTTSKKYSEGGFDFIVTVTTGKRRPRRGEGTSWVPFKSRRVTLANDPTGKFMGRLYNDFGRIVLEPDFDGWDLKYWAKLAGIPLEKLSDFYDAAEKALLDSKKDI